MTRRAATARERQAREKVIAAVELFGLVNYVLGRRETTHAKERDAFVAVTKAISAYRRAILAGAGQ